MARALFQILCKIGDRLLPEGAAFWLRYRYHLRYGEAELAWVKRLCSADETFLDVGAAQGVYAFAALGRVRRLCLFEPNPAMQEALRRVFPQTRLFDCALSAEEGRIELRTPVVRGIAYHGVATIEQRNDLALLV